MDQCCSDGTHEEVHRIISLHGDSGGVNAVDDYASNRVSTSKYSILTFLPKNLFEQFHRFANMYFLMIIIINFVPDVNAFAKEIAMFPLISVLSVTLLKDGLEDYRRHVSDKKLNSIPVQRFIINDNDHNRISKSCIVEEDRSYFENVEVISRSELMVGDYVLIRRDETVPADLLLLATSSNNGNCSVNTASLDGETNLKIRQAPRFSSQESDISTRDIPQLYSSSLLKCDLPNNKIYSFHGVLSFPDKEEDRKTVPLNSQNLLLTGCVLINTDWAVGVVVYAGFQTKIMLNSIGIQTKRSQLERALNPHVIFMVILLVFLCSVGTVGAQIWESRNAEKAWYISGKAFSRSIFVGSLLSVLLFIILLQSIIPISLYITLELCKLGQLFFISRDVRLYHAPTNTPGLCRAWNIFEDLGQVTHIFSDKTGTLTNNRMLFGACSVLGESYAHEHYGVSDIRIHDTSTSTVKRSVLSQENPLTVLAPNVSLHKILNNEKRCRKSSDQSNTELLALKFFLSMALCNTVIPKDNITVDSISDFEEEPTSTNMLFDCNNKEIPMQPVVGSDKDICSYLFESESPDELALVGAACSYGFRMVSRSQEHITLRHTSCLGRKDIGRNFVDQDPLKSKGCFDYEVIHTNTFDPERKRMSVIIRLPIDDSSLSGRIFLFVKGADSTMMDALLCTSLPSEIDMHAATLQHLQSYSEAGLRTLVFGCRELNQDFLDAWLLQYNTVSASMSDDRERSINELVEQLECGLTLLGATGVEDELQDGVPESLEKLRGGGIQVWMLTGDKQETAISIAHSCSLLTPDMHIFYVLVEREASFNIILEEMENEMRSFESSDRHFATVIRGQVLPTALSERNRDRFLQFVCNCAVIVCCRATPFQKALLVRSVKEHLSKCVTLAIGDGANDVPMLETAHIGIGLYGKEGSQAISAADFALGKFSFLLRLLLVHGHWCYHRNANLVLCMFFKNVVVVLVLFYYQCYNGWSGQLSIEPFYLVLYSIVFTALTPFMVGLLDQDVNAGILMAHPSLYGKGRLKTVYNWTNFVFMLLNAVWQSLAIFLIPLYGTINTDGSGMWFTGFITITALVLSVNLDFAMQLKHWNILTHIILWGSMLIYPIIVLISSESHSVNRFGLDKRAFSSAIFWVVLLLTVVTALIPHYFALFIQMYVYPTPVDSARAEKTIYNSSIRSVY